jgi:hypothetical protein
VRHMEPTADAVVWVRRPLSEGRANKDVERPLWHRAVSVNDTAVKTACQRFFVTPLDMRADVPNGDSVCRLCEGRTAADRPLAVPNTD